nr:MAG TPA: hypothetical protein [Caudoviricetes sp.]
MRPEQEVTFLCVQAGFRFQYFETRAPFVFPCDLHRSCCARLRYLPSNQCSFFDSSYSTTLINSSNWLSVRSSIFFLSSPNTSCVATAANSILSRPAVLVQYISFPFLNLTYYFLGVQLS